MYITHIVLSIILHIYLSILSTTIEETRFLNEIILPFPYICFGIKIISITNLNKFIQRIDVLDIYVINLETMILL